MAISTPSSLAGRDADSDDRLSERREPANVNKSRSKQWQRDRKDPRLWRRVSTVAEPEAKKSSRATLSGLPVELRLNIFEHVFDHQTPITLYNGSDIVVLVNTARKVAYSTKSIHSSPTDLLRVCRSIHDETKGVFFDRSLFGIIASPYQEPVKFQDGIAAVKPVPSEHISMPVLQQVRRVLFIMYLRGPAYDRYGYRVGDLRYLQAMTNLKEIRIVLLGSKAQTLSDACMAPVQAIMESMPPSARVHFGRDTIRPLNYENGQDAGPDPSSANLPGATEAMRRARIMYAYVQDYASRLRDRQGALSGSRIDHSFCGFKNCVEGKVCTNSEIERPPPKKRKTVSKLLSALAPTRGMSSVWHGNI